MECLRLRVKDIDFTYGQLTIRDGKGEKDRITMLPRRLRHPLMRHLQKVEVIHEQDVAAGYGEVFLPYALASNYPNAPREWAWQYVFPRQTDPSTPEAERNGLRHGDTGANILRSSLSKRTGVSLYVKAARHNKSLDARPRRELLIKRPRIMKTRSRRLSWLYHRS